MTRIIFVTTNKGKLKEANAIGAEYNMEFVQNDCDLFEVQSNDIRQVAEESAKEAWKLIKKPLIVEDSGFFVSALKGFPGVYSAFVLKTIGVDGILKLMEGVKDRSGVMKSAVAFIDGSDMKIFLGQVEGTVSEKAKGEAGFGYDPIFMPKGATKTFGEDEAYKNRVSHRAQSIKAFCQWYAKR